MFYTFLLTFSGKNVVIFFYTFIKWSANWSGDFMCRYIVCQANLAIAHFVVDVFPPCFHILKYFI